MGFELTKEQQIVVDNRNNDLLVAAAAGSGKTAVLVKRIVDLICDNKNPVDIDTFLIVTFTKAAAGEMRERIIDAINERLNVSGDDTHLKKQAALAHFAKISTIDSFCANILKEHFDKAGVSADFITATKGELDILEAEVLEELISRKFEEEDKEFQILCDIFFKKNTLKSFKEIVLRISEASESYPWPKKWLNEQKEIYSVNSLADIENMRWYKDAYKASRDSLNYIREEFKRALEFVETRMDFAKGEHPYANTLRSDIEELNYILEGKDNEYYKRLVSIDFIRIATIKKELQNEDSLYIKAQRDRLKESIKSLFKTVIDKESLLMELKHIKTYALPLFDFIIEYQECLMEKKIKNNVFSFSDIEHLALKILRDEKTNNITETAKNLSEFYSHIMIDEYQDSNLLQEEILTALTKSGDSHNYFMVGDIKQSIYRFRKARPQLFNEKYKIFKEDGEQRTAIDLSMNFRSRSTVTDFVNNVFSEIMHKDIGGIEYDDNAMLRCGALYDKETDQYETEAIIAASDEEEFVNARLDKDYIEAKLIAKKIKKIVGKLDINDKDTIRKAQYSDIVILHRSANKVSKQYIKAINEEGIPISSAGAKGYFANYEIQSLLAMITILDNPYDDIALVCVLTNFYGFTKNDLTSIRAEKIKEEHYFADTFFRVAESKNNKKAKRFLAEYEKISEQIKGKKIYEIIGIILNVEAFESRLCGLPDKDARLANIHKLIDLGISFEKTNKKGLYDFVSYINGLTEYDSNFEGAVAASAGSVRLMTIHKSKGLEFPVCFVSGMFSSLATSKAADNGIVINDTYGVGLEYIDKDAFVRMPTSHHLVLDKFEKTESTAELQRLLYVAFTRAKEKLILTGVAKENEIEKTLLESSRGEVSFDMRNNMNNFFKVVMPVLKKHNYNIERYGACDLVLDSIKQIVKEKVLSDVLMDLPKPKKEELEKVKLDVEFVYPQKASLSLKSKYSVSEVKMRHSQSEEEPDEEIIGKEEFKKRIPRFMDGHKDKKNIGAIRGRAYHRALECLEFSGNIDIGKALDNLAQSGHLSNEERGLIKDSKIKALFDSDLGKRMIAANTQGELFKEKTFVCSLPTKNIFPEIEYYKDKDNDTTLIQGIIDAYFIEDGKIVLLDYKTDKVENIEELREKYKKQLDLYKDALLRATNMEISEVLIYSFEKDTVLEI